MKWVYFVMQLLHGLVRIIKTQNDIIDLTFDNFYEKQPGVWEHIDLLKIV